MKKDQKIFLVILIAICAGAFFIFMIATTSNPLVGTWERNTGTKLTFFSDGTAYWGNTEYCYEIEDGVISMCWECYQCDDDSYVSRYEYSIEGDTLIFGGIQYTRVK